MLRIPMSLATAGNAAEATRPCRVPLLSSSAVSAGCHRQARRGGRLVNQNTARVLPGDEGSPEITPTGQLKTRKECDA